MRMWAISTRANKPENDDPPILEPIELAAMDNYGGSKCSSQLSPNGLKDKHESAAKETGDC
jgi:hypothetical protein